MKIAFPALCPKTRSYTPGQYATKRFESISGAGITRLYGSQPYNGTIDFGFFVDDYELEKIFDCWHQAKGAYYSIRLPKLVFKGMARGLFLKELEWRWVEEPQVKSVIKKRSDVTAKFVAVLEAD